MVDGQTKTSLATLPVCTDSEMGLLGIAIDPAFSTNGYVYLYRTAPGAGGCNAADRFNQVVRVTLAGGAVDLGSLAVLITDLATTGGNHNGGGLRIGPDGKLYTSVGEAGTAANAQTFSNCLGKVLRTELNGAAVADNPFVGTPGACETIYAFGLRNPFRFGFDPVTNRLWLGDVGSSLYEEINVISAGANYGWPNCEGTSGCGAGITPPIFAYPHPPGAGALGETIIGGTFANFGSGFDYFFADYISEIVYRATPNGARDALAGPPNAVATDANGPVDLITGPDGAVYYVALHNGEVRRLSANAGFPGVAAPGSADKTAPQIKLSARRSQDIDRLAVTVTLNEPGAVAASATVRTPRNAARLYRFKQVKRSAAAGRATRLRVKMRAGTKRQVKRALRRQSKRLKAKIVLTARDAAGNLSTARISVRLKP